MNCASCGTKVSTRGPAPKSGRRYCMKQDCRTAKARDDHQDVAPAYRDLPAPTKCSSCGIELPARKKRRGDSPLGRWCSKKRCQGQRQVLEEGAQLADLQASSSAATADRDFLLAWVRGDAVECDDCGRQCVVGFVHPAIGVRVPCHGLGDRAVQREVVDVVWPGWLQAYDEG